MFLATVSLPRNRDEESDFSKRFSILVLLLESSPPRTSKLSFRVDINVGVISLMLLPLPLSSPTELNVELSKDVELTV